MSQRVSGYVRRDDDAYWTPKWVWDCLYDVEPQFRGAFDCAPAVRGRGYDFLADWDVYGPIATNPPYGRLAERFVRHALDMPDQPDVAMLLPHAWDAAKGRRSLFERPPFKAKYTLVERIRWENLDQKKAGPSQNHAWFVWDWRYQGRPFLGYLP